MNRTNRFPIVSQYYSTLIDKDFFMYTRLSHELLNPRMFEVYHASSDKQNDRGVDFHMQRTVVCSRLYQSMVSDGTRRVWSGAG